MKRHEQEMLELELYEMFLERQERERTDFIEKMEQEYYNSLANGGEENIMDLFNNILLAIEEENKHLEKYIKENVK